MLLTPPFFRFCLILISSCLMVATASAQIIWQEDFSGYPNGTQQSSRWTTVFGDCDSEDTPPLTREGAYWGVENGRFRVNDIEGRQCIGIRGDNQNVFTTEVIDISEEGCVELSVDIRASGGLECNFFFEPWTDVIPGENGHDQLVVQYQLDGGAWVQFPDNGYICGGINTPGTATADNISGDEVRIRILVGTQGNDENYFFDNIRVTSNTNTYELPTFDTICVSAGPLSLPTTLNRVRGTWSGPGVTVNAFSPGTAGAGTHQLRFTPRPGQCAVVGQLSITVQPPAQFDPVADRTACGSLVLPPITGTYVPGNAAYYTGPDGTGNRYLPGDTISGSQQLYIYGGSAGCTDQTTFQINVASDAQLSRPDDTSVCHGYILPVPTGFNLQGPTAYSTAPNGQGTILQPGDTIFQSGQYYLFDGSGACLVQDSFSITVLPTPSFSLPAVDTFCDRYMLPALTGTNLSPAAGYFTQPGGQGAALTPGDTLISSQVIYLYDNWNGCIGTDSLQLTGFSTPILTPIPDRLVCDSFFLPEISGRNLNNPQYFSGIQGSGDTLSVGTRLDRTRRIFLYDQNGQCFDTTSFQVMIHRLSFSVAQTDTIRCAGAAGAGLQAIIREGTPPFQYNWSVDSLDGRAFAQNLTAGTYSLTITDQHTCTNSVQISIPEPAPLTVTCHVVSDVTVPRGSDGRLQITVGGGSAPYQILLTGPVSDRIQIDSSGSVTIPAIPAGDYRIQAIDRNGCRSDCTATITAPPCDLSGNPTVVAPRCAGDSDGQITFSPTGGTAPYTFDWSVDSLDGRAFAQNLTAGTYPVTVTGANGCTYDTTLTVPNPTPLTLICRQEGIAAVLQAIGGQPPFTIAYSGPQTDTITGVRALDSLIVPGLLPGDYLFSVTDSSGCSSSCTLNIPHPDCTLNLNVLSTPESCPAAGDGALILNTSGGAGAIRVRWADGATDSIRTGLAPGDYSVTVTDELRCEETQSVTVSTAHPLPTYQLATRDGTVCANGCDTVDISANGSQRFQLTLEIATADTTVFRSLDFSEEAGTGTGQARVPVCPSTYPSGNDRIVYTVRSLEDAFCRTDSVQTVETIPIPLDTTRLDTVLCPGDTLEAGGEVFDRFRREGLVTLPGSSRTGCDSFLFVSLQVLPVDTLLLRPTLCFGDSLWVNGSRYDQQRPRGWERFPRMAANGCDSLVRIDLTFLSEKRDTLAPLLCRTDTVNVNGRAYFFGESQGLEILPGAGANGCDSTVVIDLQFLPSDTMQLDTVLCAGDSLLVNGTRYDAARPEGVEVFLPGHGGSCDSVVQVRALFQSLPVTHLEPVLCFGDSLIIGNDVFNADRPTGEVLFPRSVAEGCDSTVIVALTYREVVDTLLRPTLCPEDQLMVNGTTYDRRQPVGTEFIPGGSRSGCDSLVRVQLQFFAQDTQYVQERRCPDQPFTLFGETFTPDRPSGLIRLPAANQYGCDSLIAVDISFSREELTIGLPREIIVRQGDSIRLEPRYSFDPVEVIWVAHPDLDIPPLPNPLIVPGTSARLDVTALDAAGCSASATTRLVVDRRVQVFAPTAFRPGAGGANGRFSLFGGNQIREIKNLRIFDRWGSLLFEAESILPNQPEAGWDGTYQGQEMPAGIYVYAALLILQDGREEPLQGDIMLIR